MSDSTGNNGVPVHDDLERPKILIVHDNSAELFAIETMLSKLEVTLFEAGSGAEALSLCERHDFACIMIKLELKEMDGYQTALQLYERDRAKSVPCIFLGTAVEETFEQLVMADMTVDHCELPVIPAVLLAKTNMALHIHRYRRALDKEILKRRRVEEKLKQTAQVDQTTFIANRRYFKQQYAVEWRRALREYKPFSMIMVDIDFFEAFRDRYGSQASDLCVIRVGKAIRQVISRAADFVARIEGAGFVLVLPSTPSKGAVKLAERILERIHKLSIEHANSPVSQQVTVSMGVATVITSPNIEPNELIAMGDQALFRAKKDGGNQFFVQELK
ncbi:MAG: diguanylate cyclase [Acidobacteria bacterium]|nr:diguanylate cyclase [Acidobacteriota bacterium]